MDPVDWASRRRGNADLVAAALENEAGEPRTLGEFLAQMESEARHQERTFGRGLAKRETNRVSRFRRVLFGGDRPGSGNRGLVSRVLGALEANGLPEGWANHVGEALLIELGLGDASAAANHAHLSSHDAAARGGRPLAGAQAGTETPRMRHRSDLVGAARVDHRAEMLSEHASDGTAWGI
jgi:hypothetical protein